MAEFTVVDATPSEIDKGMVAYFDHARERMKSLGNGNTLMIEFIDEAVEQAMDGYRSLDEVGRCHPLRAEALQDILEVNSPALRNALDSFQEYVEASKDMEDGESLALPDEMFESTERYCEVIREAGEMMREKALNISASDRLVEQDMERVGIASSAIEVLLLEDKDGMNPETVEMMNKISASRERMRNIQAMFRENGDFCKPYQMRPVYEIYRTSLRNVADRLERIVRWGRRAMVHNDREVWDFARNTLEEIADAMGKYFKSVEKELSTRYRGGESLSGNLFEISSFGPSPFKVHDASREVFLRASRKTAETGQEFSRSIVKACLQQGVSKDGALQMLNGIRQEIGLGIELISMRGRKRTQETAR